VLQQFLIPAALRPPTNRGGNCSHALQEKKAKKKTKSNTVATKRAKKALRKKQAKPPKNAVKKKQSSKMISSKMTSSKVSPSGKRKTPVRRAQRLETSGKKAQFRLVSPQT
jgi:hypothetical protein